MRQLVPLVVLVFLTMSVNAQIQKTRNNRVYVDEDYEYTEAARRTRTINEQMQKGLAAYRAGDFQAAVEAFGLVVNLDPTMFAAQHDLGASRIRLGDYATAADDLRKALALNPQSVTTWHLLGFTLYNLHRTEEALNCYMRALEIDKDQAITWNSVGHAYIDMARFDAAAVFQRSCWM